ncbi:domain found in IF2B/IF5-domain-containing protein [Cytidiella melzeri]|nr:domain found in IF2B/IF5-domain-containing protein [Cytidiella melzeri]
MSEEPLFDPSLKKRKKKKTVAFSEDPLGAEADPTTPAPESIDDTTTDGVSVDMGSKTVHEQLAQGEKDEAKGDAEEGFGEIKKKKKKSIPMDLPEEGSGRSTPVPEATDDLDFSDLKKKKKKKKDIPLDLPEDGSGAATPVGGEATEDLDFSDLKKKKKSSKKKANLDMEAFERELSEAKAKDEDGEEDEEVDAAAFNEIDEGEHGENPFARAEDSVQPGNESEPWLGSDRDYTYPELLRRFYGQLHVANPTLLANSGKRYVIAPPSVAREGNKKTMFANVSDICKRMHRPPEHAIQYLFAELGTTGSVDGAGRLIIRGKFQQKQIENVLRHYITEYVACKMCKSHDTLLTKENRIFFVSCESCGSRRSVNAIKTGFQAQVGKRIKNKTG